jgi:hypothetical protein
LQSVHYPQLEPGFTVDTRHGVARLGDYSSESKSESSSSDDDAAARSDNGAGAREDDGINDEDESAASSVKGEGEGVENDDDGGGSADLVEDVDGGDGSKTYDDGDAVDGGGELLMARMTSPRATMAMQMMPRRRRSRPTSPNGAALVKWLPWCERCRWRRSP